MNVVNVAQRVPLGIALLGFLRSPDMEAPAKIPDVALHMVSVVMRSTNRLEPTGIIFQNSA